MLNKNDFKNKHKIVQINAKNMAANGFSSKTIYWINQCFQSIDFIFLNDYPVKDLNN